jgi:hypothetical protein
MPQKIIRSEVRTSSVRSHFGANTIAMHKIGSFEVVRRALKFDLLEINHKVLKWPHDFVTMWIREHNRLGTALAKWVSALQVFAAYQP